MSTTTTPAEFMARHGITGNITTVAGPRLNIDRIRNRFTLRERQAVHQRAYIDLHTYTAHCYTFGEGLSPYACKKESENVARILAPVARLARIQGVTAKGERPAITQRRELVIAFHEAGVQTVTDPRGILLDMDRLVRIAQVPWVDTKTRYEVLLRPTPTNDVWGVRFSNPRSLRPLVKGMRLDVLALDEPEPNVVALLLEGANKLMAEVFGPTWNTATR